MSIFDQTGYRNNYPITKVLDRLYLGGFKNAEDLGCMNHLGITHICNCTTEKLPLSGKHFNILQLNQLDNYEWNPSLLEMGVRWVHKALHQGGIVLVHCHAGISRSPSLVASYLYTCGFDFDRALDRITEQRPIVKLAPSILSSAKHTFGISPIARTS